MDNTAHAHELALALKSGANHVNVQTGHRSADLDWQPVPDPKDAAISKIEHVLASLMQGDPEATAKVIRMGETIPDADPHAYSRGRHARRP
jgi:hypothetical protein